MHQRIFNRKIELIIRLRRLLLLLRDNCQTLVVFRLELDKIGLMLGVLFILIILFVRLVLKVTLIIILFIIFLVPRRSNKIGIPSQELWDILVNNSIVVV